MSEPSTDTRRVLSMFSELDSRRQVKAYKTALKKSADILVKETRRQLRMSTKSAGHRNWWNNKRLDAGVMVSVGRSGDYAKVHILGDFRLKFFELGTSPRQTSGRNTGKVRGRVPQRRQKKPAPRGSAKAKRFFTAARSNAEREVFDSMDRLTAQSIIKVYERYK